METATNGLGAIGTLKSGKIYRTPMEKLRIVREVFAKTKYADRKQVAVDNGVNVGQAYAWHNRLGNSKHHVKKTPPRRKVTPTARVDAQSAVPMSTARAVSQALAALVAAVRDEERQKVLLAIQGK